MLNKEKIALFWKSRANIKDPRLATYFKHANALNYDLGFIYNYINPCFRLLDLGCRWVQWINALEP